MDAICDWLLMSVMDSGLKVTVCVQLNCYSGPDDLGSCTASILLLPKVKSLPSKNLKLPRMGIVLFHLI